MKITCLALTFLIANSVFCQDTDSSNFYFKKGMEQKGARHFLMAAKYFDKAVQFNPQYKQAWLENGYTHLEMHKTTIAKAHFTKVYALDPLNQTVIRELTSLYFDCRQFAKAIEFAAKCTSCDDAEKITAMSNYHLENYDAAVKGLQNVLVKNPADAEASYTLGRTYAAMELHAKAVPHYTKAVELNATKNGWCYELGLLYYNLNDFKHALEYFIKAGDAGYPQSNDYTENLGYAHLYGGDFNTGEKILLALLAKKPGNKDILRDIAEAYYRQKLYDKSLEFCKQLMDLDMNDAKTLYQAGLCFQQKGEKEKGQGMCDKAIQLDPSLSALQQKNNLVGLAPGP